ncbi:ABC transporter permease [Tatumella ptyseos]|uniref:ABC transporter permease n=1 Tax=Tatumella ptyseos TaxID=82987 RepID=UPI0026F23971|nr:ABC transporter permease [Tatumella ptyseos]WKX26675.1 ABC transporter permease [Tatumella ptyseos]
MIKVMIICALINKEIKEIVRDRVIIVMILVMPLLNLIIMGYSINLDARNVPTSVIDHDNSPFSRSLLYAMKNSEYFDIEVMHDETLARKKFASGTVKIIVHIPHDFSKSILKNYNTDLLVETDATDPSSTANALQTLQHLIENAQYRELYNYSSLSASPVGNAKLVFRKWFNPRGNSQINIVPGLIGMILSIMPMLMVSLSIVKERERGTLQHIKSSGINPFIYLTGKSIPYVSIGLLQLILMLGMSIVILDIPMKGSYIELLSVSAFFIILSVIIGVSLTTVITNQLQAMQLLSFYFLFSNMLSGFLSPFEAMPQWSQWLGNLIPLTHFMRVIRGIMIKGNSVTIMSTDLLHLASVFLTIGIVGYILVKVRWTEST